MRGRRLGLILAAAKNRLAISMRLIGHCHEDERTELLQRVVFTCTFLHGREILKKQLHLVSRGG